MTYAADEYAEINRNRKQARKDEGLGDDDWRTASGDDLDACATSYDIDRWSCESDLMLRGRIEAVFMKRELNRQFFV